MPKCYICGCEITKENESLEHIIPNGIGGHLTSKRILCATHNNELDKYDYFLCKDLEYFTNLLNPKRDRGENPKVSYNHQKMGTVTREADGNLYTKPQIKVLTDDDGKSTIHYQAFYSAKNENREKFLEHLKNIVIGKAQKDKLPDEKIQEILTKIDVQMNASITNIDNPEMYYSIAFNQNGNLFFSFYKIAFDFYFGNDLSMTNVEKSLQAFKSKDLLYLNKNANYYYPHNFYLDTHINHSIVLKGDKSLGKLYCLISLYGVLNALVLLNDDYKGEDFYKSYVYDLRNNKKIPFNKDIILNGEDLAVILSPATDYSLQMVAAMNNFKDYFVAYKRAPEDLQEGIERIFEDLQQIHFIKTREEYNSIIREQVFEFLNSDKVFKRLLDTDKEGLFTAILNFYNYEKYLTPKYLDILNKAILKELETILLYEQTLLEDVSKLTKKITSKLLLLRTDNETLNTMLFNDRETFEQTVGGFINSIYEMLFVWRDILNSAKNN